MSEGDRPRLLAGVAKLRSGLAGQLAGVFGRGRLSDDDWEELEDLLIAADVGPTFAAELVEELRGSGAGSDAALVEIARRRLLERLGEPDVSLPEAGNPAVILIVGVNGSGKTTTIAKLAARLKREGHAVVLAAGDTFRAGAIAQLQHWGRVLDLRVIAQAPGADPGSVAYDAADAAQASGADYLIVDTAGRLQTDSNLMRELEKVARVLARRIAGAPHQTLLVLDGMSGLNGLSQSRKFAEGVGLDGVVISKMDGTAKGGIALSVVEELGIPVKFVGTGEGVGDLAGFDPAVFVDAILGRRPGPEN